MKREMALEMIDCETFKRALLAGKTFLQEHVEEINRLNVFPVPDGDTGTNMLLTMDAVTQGLDDAVTSLPKLMDRVSRQALLGARGNSGVILAQFFVGFAAAVDDKEVIDADALAEGFISGTEEAYRIVSHPQEGTILTIMRTARDAIVKLRTRPLQEIVAAAHNNACEALARTPEMLPILRRAGVIDAGGLGFVYLLAALAAILDKEPHPSTPCDSQFMHQSEVALEKIQEEAPTHRYCTEFIVGGKDIPQVQFRTRLALHADSVLVLGNADLTRVHLHTDDPGEALRIAATYGRVSQVKVDDMYEQVQGFMHRNDSMEKSKRRTALVAVSVGEGITEIMRSIGADKVITGNPSVGELLEVISRADGEGIILLPNDPNILLVCEQAMELTWRAVAIVPSESVPQGISALLAHDPQQGLKEDVRAMQQAMDHVRSASVGRAARTSTLNGKQIAVGDYVGMVEREIVTSGKSIHDIILHILELMDRDSSEVVTLFYGSAVEERDAADAAVRIRSRYPNLDVQFYYGGQAYYDYLISME